MAGLILGLVRATGRRHIHIGPSDPQLLHALALGLEETGLAPELVIFATDEATGVETLRNPRWYATMCANEGTVEDRCAIIRALHHLQ